MRSAFLRRSVAASAARCGPANPGADVGAPQPQSRSSSSLETDRHSQCGSDDQKSLFPTNMQVYVIGGDGTHRGAAKLYEVRWDAALCAREGCVGGCGCP